jgi:RHS repeat-associated protein
MGCIFLSFNKLTYHLHLRHFGNARTISQGVNDVTLNEYNTSGFKTRSVDAMGNETLYTPDANGNILTETTQLTTPTGVRTLVTTKTYDKSGKVKTVLDAENNLTQYDYDANGNQTVMIDAQGRRTEMKYNAKNQLMETVYPDATPDNPDDNLRVKYTYDLEGNKTGIINPDGQATTYSYNAQKLPTGMVLPDDTLTMTDNSKIEVAYTQAGWMKTLVKNGVTTEFEYDAAGRIIVTRNTQNGETLTTRTSYDRAGRKTATIDALNHTTRYVYDNMDRLIETNYDDQSSTKTSYDRSGNAIAKTDQAGHVTRYEYDALDRLTAVVDAKLNRTEYGYDQLGNLITQKDANGHVTRYEYNGVKQRAAVVRPLLQRSETEYVKGNLVETTDFNGDQITYSYNLLNQLTGKRFVDEGDRTVTFTYDDAGKRHTAIDSRGTTTDEYNEMGQLISRVMPDNRSIGYTYDKVTGQVATVTTDSGTTTNHYNDLGQIDRVTSSEGVTTYLYNAVGNLSLTTYPNGITESRQYDNLDRLSVLENKNSSSVVLSRYQYTYDKVGNKTSVLELGGRKVEYTYDELNRLTQEKITDAVNGNRLIDYTFDAVGNRLSRVDSVAGSTTYTYDDNDRLLTETTAGVTKTYTYDRNGNTLTEQEPGKQTVYDWDSENRLIGAQITDTSGTKGVQYRYDVEGDRVSSTVNGVETRYLVDGNRQYAEVIEEYSPSGQVQTTYVHGLNLISQVRSGQTSTYLHDGFDSVRSLSNQAGTVANTYSYDAYGNLMRSTGTTKSDYGYRGEQFDPNLEMQYLRARYYDATTGRFSSVDPFEGLQDNSTSLHRYLYAYNNPISFADPSGKTTLAMVLGDGATRSILDSLWQALAISSVVTATAAIATLLGSGARNRLRSQGTRWEGDISSASSGIPSVPGLKIASLESQPSPTSVSGKWWIVPVSDFLPSFGFSAGLTVTPVEVFAKTRQPGASPSVWDLAGPYLAPNLKIRFPVSLTERVNINLEDPGFFMGWGWGHATGSSSGASVSVKIGVDVGLSIPITPDQPSLPFDY